eukprot:gene9392-biopygen10727
MAPWWHPQEVGFPGFWRVLSPAGLGRMLCCCFGQIRSLRSTYLLSSLPCLQRETAEDASGPRPGRVRFFKFYRVGRVRDASAALQTADPAAARRWRGGHSSYRAQRLGAGGSGGRAGPAPRYPPPAGKECSILGGPGGGNRKPAPG